MLSSFILSQPLYPLRQIGVFGLLLALCIATPVLGYSAENDGLAIIDEAMELRETARSASTSPALLVCAHLPMTVLGGWIKIGEASLFLNDCKQAKQLLDAIPKQFSIVFARQVSGQRLEKMARDLLAKNLGADILQQGHFACILSAYQDALEGDRYDIRFQPGYGLDLQLNQQLLAHCPDDEWSYRYFTIWFGPNPFNKRLRDHLIQQAIDSGPQPST